MAYRETVSVKLKRLLGIMVRVCLWAVPVALAGVYVYWHLPLWCHAYWHVAETQAVADQWTLRLNQAAQPIVWNPGSILIYARALLMNMAADTQAAVQSAIAQTVSGIGRVLVLIFGVWFAVRTVRKIARTYLQRKRDCRLVQATCREIMPELAAIRQELAEIQKKLSQTEQPKS